MAPASSALDGFGDKIGQAQWLTSLLPLIDRAGFSARRTWSKNIKLRINEL
eukprot:Gb_37685 [translate_table: standard]